MTDDNQQESVTEHQGQSDLVTFEVVGKPTPAYRIRQIGEDPEIRYRYDWDERGHPSPEDFERVSNLETKLLPAMVSWDGDVLEAAEEVHDAIVKLKTTMCDARQLSGRERQQVMMGNLDALPEVEHAE